MTDAEIRTIKSYDTHADEWATAHNDFTFWKHELSLFNDLLPSGKILEIGCGGGRDAHELISKGYDYTGNDPSQKFIYHAKNQNPTGTFEVKSVSNLNDYNDNSFDGFWASAVLLHIPKNKIDASLLDLHRILKPEGIGFIAIKEGDGEKELLEKSSDGNSYSRFWAFYSDQEFRRKLLDAHFQIIEHRYRPMSERTRWLIYFVKKD